MAGRRRKIWTLSSGALYLAFLWRYFMRRNWFVIVGLITVLVPGLAPAFAATGGGVPGSGCPYACMSAVYPDGTEVVYCDNRGPDGNMVTCDVVQMCYKQLGAPTLCDRPQCRGTFCMFF